MSVIDKIDSILSEKSNDYPKGFDVFIDVAKKSKDGNDFIEKARKISGIPSSTSDWFFQKYNPKGGWDMVKASNDFIKDVKKGIYDK